MGEGVRLLVRNTTGLGSRHIGAVADCINVVPFCLQGVVVDPNTGFRIG